MEYRESSLLTVGVGWGPAVLGKAVWGLARALLKILSVNDAEMT